MTEAEQGAVRDASTAFASDLEEMQRIGSESLAANGDVAGFYRTFAEVTDEAAARYEALQLPAEVAAVQTQLVTLLEEQATLLAQIAEAATRGEDDSLTPQLERLTELLGDVTTTNAELLRSTGVDAPVVGA